MSDRLILVSIHPSPIGERFTSLDPIRARRRPSVLVRREITVTSLYQSIYRVRLIREGGFRRPRARKNSFDYWPLAARRMIRMPKRSSRSGSFRMVCADS